jgi:hypothetical protein
MTKSAALQRIVPVRCAPDQTLDRLREEYVLGFEGLVHWSSPVCNG